MKSGMNPLRQKKTRFMTVYIVLIGIGISCIALIGLEKLDVLPASMWKGTVHADEPSPSPVPQKSSTLAKSSLNGTIEMSRAASIIPLTNNEKIWLTALAHLQILPGDLFSYNQWMGQTAKANGFEGNQAEHSHIAGLLYEAAVRAGLEVGERNTHLVMPKYAAIGFDTVIESGKKNLTIANLQSYAITVEVDITGNDATLRLVGNPTAEWKAPHIQINQEKFAPDSLILIDYSLGGAISENVRQAGTEGLLVKVICDCSKRGESKLFTKDYYAPQPTVIARAPIPAAVSADVPIKK
jgi:vancomycin resistance protein YoaR